MKKTIKSVKRSLKNICFVDKILIIYMIILLVYTAVHLFSTGGVRESGAVDVVVRTSASAIFGYFISNNFIKTTGTKKEKEAAPEANTGQPEEKESDAEKVVCCDTLQIAIVSGIGLVSLALLLASKYLSNAAPEITATVSQLRDFLSACIGFLVGCGKAK